MKNVRLDENCEVVKLYTDRENIDFEGEDLLEKCMVYETIDEAEENFENEITSFYPIGVYGLKVDGEVIENTIGLDAQRAYNYYYWNLAKEVDEFVFKDENRGYGIKKRYVALDIDNQNEDGTYNITKVFKEYQEKTLPMFALIDLKGDGWMVNSFVEEFPTYISPKLKTKWVD